MASAELSAGLSGRLEQRQHLSQAQRHSLELLELPVTALENRIAAELTTNPMLESDPIQSAAEAGPDLPPETEDENDYERNSVAADEWANELPLPADPSEEEGKRDLFGSIPAPEPQVRDLLHAELNTMRLPENLFRIAGEIVASIDDDGYLDKPLADIALICDAEMEEAAAALKIVQETAPAGVGARDLAECLMLQLGRAGKLTPNFRKLLGECLPDLEKNRFAAIEKKLRISGTELEAMLKTLRSLNPAPGRGSSGGAAVVIPDLAIVRKEDGEYAAVPKRSPSGRVVISTRYEKLLEDKFLSPVDREFLTEKLNSARELIRALAMREDTLTRIGNLLIRRQREFLDRGKKFLKPMTMKEAAADLDLSESTISRTAAEKFVETPQGVFPLRFFFSAGYRSADGEDLSNQAVMEKIRAMIAEESADEPLSDEAISQMLNRSGIPVARRTVAKYRQAMKIAPSSARRKLG